MKLAIILHLYLKDLRETLRDRKTLLFLFLFPLILMPLSIFGISRLALSVVTKQVAKPVVIAATPEDQTLYLTMAHRQFLDSSFGQAIKLARNPLANYLLPEAQRDLLSDLPDGIFNDPHAYYTWSQEVASKLTEAIQDPLELLAQVDNKIPDELSALTPAAAPDSSIQNIGRDLMGTFLTTIQGVGLVTFVDATENLDKEESGISSALTTEIREKRLDGYLRFNGDVSSIADPHGDQFTMDFYYLSSNTDSVEASRRIGQVHQTVNQYVVEQRLSASGLKKTLLDSVTLTRNDLASASEQTFSIMGGLLPYLIIAFAYLGGFYPAIDIGAGEKERRTLETLLLSPATRTEIALGKFLVLFTTSVTAALLGIVAMAFSFWLLVPEVIIQKLELNIPVSTIVTIALLSIPPSAIMAGLFLSISIYARSFKEAQNYMAPMGILIILPAGVAMLPGFDLTYGNALIPFVNVSLLSRDFLKGDEPWLEYVMALGSSIVVAAMCVAFAVYQFRKESVIFRS